MSMATPRPHDWPEDAIPCPLCRGWRRPQYPTCALCAGVIDRRQDFNDIDPDFYDRLCDNHD